MSMVSLTVFFPLVMSLFLLFSPENIWSNVALTNNKDKSAKTNYLCRLNIFVLACLFIEFVFTIICVITIDEALFELFRITDSLIISFRIDHVGRIFAVIIAIIWLFTGIYSFEYMKHENNLKRYYASYIAMFGVLNGLSFAGNLTTYYAFYEILTIGSFALVIHNQSKEAIMAALKYLFYSFAGAYMVLFGIYFVNKYSLDKAMNFADGGIVDYSRACMEHAGYMTNASIDKGVLSIAFLFMILGFSVKAGMFPMHGWLPTAHPVAPAPASAVLSGIIVKAGVLGIIRVIYFVFGKDAFNGSYVQTIMLSLSLITVFMGSMMAYKEKVLKKRLAYSTVSQVSYILFGLFIVNDTAYYGALIHVVAHAFIKCTLFICAGAIIHITGCTRVDELCGIGKKMPIMLACYTVASLGLIGIPPFGGFASKWYLATGAIASHMPVFSLLGPIVLLLSALLTAGYLLPISINGFLPGKDFTEFMGSKVCYEPKPVMLIPIILLTVLSILIGMFPGVIL